MPEEGTDWTVAGRLEDLPAGDRRLLAALLVASLAALALGLLYALGLVADLADVVRYGSTTRFQLLTLHATTAFYYWLYFVQAGVVLAVLRLYAPAVERIRWRRLGWAGGGCMAVGFLLNHASTLAGAAVTYVAPAPLATQYRWAGVFYLGYLALSVGLALLALVAVRTALAAKRPGQRTWPSLLFACVLWWGLAAVSAVASVNAYLPPMLDAVGIAVKTPASYLMNWSVLFHNMHYLPLISAVVVWYVVAEDATGAGVKLVYSGQFTKYVFAFYLLLVPPTSLYHMFLSPSVAPVVKATGSVLALLMSVPTILHFLVIVAALETAARSSGAGGLVGWVRQLPWDNPGVGCVGAAVACAAGGGLLANVLVQHGFATLLSDTLFVPAYFHFFTAGTVTLTFVGALAYLLPPLFDRPLPRPRWVARLPVVVTVGVYGFGVAGAVAGYLGVPRRTLSPTGVGTPAVWFDALHAVAAGGLVMALGLLALVALLGRVVVGDSAEGWRVTEFPRVEWGESVDRRHPVHGGLITMAVLVVGWFVLTLVTWSLR